jgi:GWxTD domain-containing protein
VAGAVHPDEGPGPLPWRVGGQVGFTVDAAAFPDSAGGHRLEVYVRVPPATLTALTADSTGSAQLRLIAKLKSGFGGKNATETSELEVVRDGAPEGFGRVVVLAFPMRSGPQRLEVRLEDVRSRKRGIAYMGRKVSEYAEVKGEFSVTIPKSGLDVSGIQFVWSERAAQGANPFVHGSREIVPNPERLYGLYANEVRAAFTARGAADDDRPWHWTARVHDASGQVVAERESTQAAAPVLEASAFFDVTQQPAGGYEMELRVERPGDKAAVERRSRFSVGWQAGSWFRNPRDVEDAVHLLLSPDDEEAFAFMQAGEQEHLLAEFWRIRDPSPGTATNEAYEKFRQRAAHANRTYARLASGPGMLTDMGRTYVRYGEPSEILRQVVPGGDNTLLQMLRAIERSEDRPVGDVEQKGPGGDMRPFEVWVYDEDIPPPVDADPREPRVHRKRMVFLFVDEHGYGNYTLRYSTE